jgi:hypothetical protein
VWAYWLDGHGSIPGRGREVEDFVGTCYHSDTADKDNLVYAVMICKVYKSARL